jgi:general nucleoside transport system permease protein
VTKGRSRVGPSRERRSGHGGITILQLYAQGSGLFHLPAQLLSMLPYLATIAVLTIISAGPWKGWLNAPACLGKSFHPTV